MILSRATAHFILQIAENVRLNQGINLLASRNECPGSLCHSPGVGVGIWMRRQKL